MKRFSKLIGPLLGFVMLALALWFLHRQLAKQSVTEIATNLKNIPRARLALACLFVVTSNVVLTFYDALGLRTVGARVPYHQTALASFVSYAISHNLGFSAFTGAPFRFRIYRRHDVKPLQIAGVIAFCGVSFWLGFMSFGGTALAFNAAFLSGVTPVPKMALRAAGIGLMIMAMAYVAFAARGRKSVSFRKHTLPLPGLNVALPQIACSILDWFSIGTTLYFLFPETMPLSYGDFLSVFVLAQLSVFTSQVPGGIGVIESVFIACLSPAIPATAVFGSLIAYRAIYYLVPLFIAAILIGVSEFLHKRSEKNDDV